MTDCSQDKVEHWSCGAQQGHESGSKFSFTLATLYNVLPFISSRTFTLLITSRIINFICPFWVLIVSLLCPAMSTPVLIPVVYLFTRSDFADGNHWQQQEPPSKICEDSNQWREEVQSKIWTELWPEHREPFWKVSFMALLVFFSA